MHIIDGRAIAERIKDDITKEIYALGGPRPHLAIILVGDREDSQLYVSLKQKEAAKVGVDASLYKFAADVDEAELLASINFLNRDETIDAVLVQLPLPQNLSADKIISALSAKKDADGFHPQHPDYVISPVLAAVRASLLAAESDWTGKTACVMHNSDVFGEGLKELLINMGLSVLSAAESVRADVVVTAVGKARSLKADMIKEGATVVDIGISKIDGHVFGDVDFEAVKDKVNHITPVPGGIGPMTIAFLFRNVLEIYKHRAALGK